LGADVILNPGNPNNLEAIKHLTHGKGVDKALDCSGVLAAQRFCLDAVRRKGHVTFVGESTQELPVTVSPDLIRKGISLSGAWHYNLSLFPLIMQVIQNSLVVRHLISHTLPMSQVQQAFEISASRQCAKIILKPWE
jgi:threonine dehydrogenase-like Zn-dependent dehydrogenase